jgi:hypothetical protein
MSTFNPLNPFAFPLRPGDLTMDMDAHRDTVKAVRKYMGLEKAQIYKFLGWNDPEIKPRGVKRPSLGLAAVNWCAHLTETRGVPYDTK